MRGLSALGDSALLLPASVALLICLAVTRNRLAALAWAATLGICGLVTIAAKLVFHACGQGIVDFDVISPSGHVSFAAAFYGPLAIMIGAGRPRAVRIAFGLGAAGLVCLIGLSRVRTGAHSPAEVVIGAGIGAACVVGFALLHRRIGRPVPPGVPILAVLATMALLFGGRHFTLEPVIAGAAHRLSVALDVCSGQGLDPDSVRLGEDDED